MKANFFLLLSPSWGYRWVLCLFMALLLQPITPVHADIGPKPKMDFEFEYQITPVSIESGELIECVDETCAESAPLVQVGPQYFKCTENSCASQSYGYRKYHKLILRFKDRERQSNIFETAATYHVIVTEDGLDVQPKRSAVIPDGSCISGGLITLIVEWLIASLYLNAFHLPRTLSGWVPLLSLLTLPAVWLLFPLLPIPAVFSTGLAEGFAILAEGLLLAWLGRSSITATSSISFKHCLLLSLIANGASFLLGLWVI